MQLDKQLQNTLGVISFFYILKTNYFYRLRWSLQSSLLHALSAVSGRVMCLGRVARLHAVLAAHRLRRRTMERRHAALDARVHVHHHSCDQHCAVYHARMASLPCRLTADDDRVLLQSLAKSRSCETGRCELATSL